MSLSRAEYLINRLISNNLSGEELSELLAGIASEEHQHSYSDVLESYFYRLVQESEEKRPGENGTN